MTKRAQRGQGLVEFALIIPIFLVLMMGLFDGTRLLFTWNELQDAARVGARWDAVNVNRDTWGTYTTVGNVPGIWNMGVTSGNLNSGAGPSSIVGQINHSLVGIDSKQITVDISQPTVEFPSCQLETGSQVGSCSGMPVTVTVSYTFVPILSFSMVHIPLQGKAISYHE